MNRSLRFLMGIGILAILVPALIMTSPGLFGGLLSNPVESGGADTIAAPAPDAIAIVPSNEEALAEDGMSRPDPSSTPSDPTESTTHPDDHSGHNGSVQNDEASKTTKPAATPTTQAATATTSTPGVQAGGVITGSACPCNVTGTVELKGDVSLKGDLVVTGGTLVARPGLNVQGNGFQIMFMDGGRADFQGSKTSTWSGNGSNANVNRDITFRNMQRIMFHGGAGKSTLRYFAILDSGTSSLGDYPLHFHLNGNSVRGTLVEGVAVVNGKNHAFVPHGSHGITFRDTIAKNTSGDAYWWDDPGTNDNTDDTSGGGIDDTDDVVYDHALAINTNTGNRGAGFKLGAGTNMVIRNSAAINTRGGHDCAGFVWPEFSQGVWVFDNNFASSSDCDGIFVWQNDERIHVVDGFTGDSVNHGAYDNDYIYRNIDVPSFNMHAQGWRMEDSTVDRFTAFRHRRLTTTTFVNVNFGQFIINNGSNSGEIPGKYVFTGTNLTCADVVYQNVVAGTTVTINGSTC